MSALKYRSDIDGLRALAVLSVVIYHVSPQSLPGGFLGVDIFFVISGYLISLIVFREQAAGTFSFADFYARRIRRIFPALAVVLLATVVFGAFSLFADEYRRLGIHAASAIVFLLNFQLMGEAGYFDVASDSKPLLHLWSLSVEEQFYLVWPALLVVLGRVRWRIGLVIGILIVGSFGFAIYLANKHLDAFYFHPLARFWELLLGAALAYCHNRFGINALPTRIDQPWMRHLLSFTGLGAIFFALFMFDGRAPHPSGLTLIPLLGTVFLMASGGSAVAGRLLALKPIVWIGLISYPLYLWHWPLLTYIRVMESGTPARGLLWIGAGAAVLLAGLTYRFIEQPLRHPSRARPALAILVSTMIVLFVASLSVVASEGLPGRTSVGYVKAAEAQIKREPASDEACKNLFAAGSAPVYCRLHNSGKQMIGLIGDSHAHVLFPGVSELAGKQGYGTLLLANSGCPPLLGAVTGRNAAERQSCAQSIETIVKAVLSDKRIVTVVIASRGPQYLTGAGFGPAEANYSYPPITTEPLPTKQSQLTPGKIFADGLLNTSLQLHQRGIRVSYLLQVPELGVPARNCLGRPLVLTPQTNMCTVEYEVYRDRMQSYRDQVLGLAQTAPYMRIINVEQALCIENKCSGFIGNQLLYADDNHLSVIGSKRVAPIIIKAAIEGEVR
ncbi:acyltransferase family protein [Polaromonas eurypsychrophila]|uniref:acyltransferase family protein n=1 Tax=Polaromonas eurypsychrophila TaxID=1614635 RepID=UPI00166F5AD6|nr:acyltransferase family protein [Polaromonas eurypsychrophila]